MPKCPNCGRATLRTEDWACQWCGYPLPHGPFKKIAQTFKQLREERLGKRETPEVDEAEEELTLEPEPEPEPEPVLEGEPEPQPPPRTKRRPAPAPKPKYEPELKAKPEPVVKYKPRPAPVPKAKPKPVVEPVAELESEPEPAPAPTMKYEPRPPSAPPPAPAPRQPLKPGPEVTEITVEGLASVYEREGTAADAKLLRRILWISGVVAKIEVKEMLSLFYIFLKSADKNLQQNVRCEFTRSSAEDLKRLVVGQAVVVQGVYDGSIINLRMKDCILVR